MRAKILIIILLLGYQVVFSQCKIDSSELIEMYSIFKKVNLSKIKRCNFQFEIGTIPDVDYWFSESKYGCISKSQVLALVKYYQNKCRAAKVKNIDNKLLENLSVLLDEENYVVDLAYRKFKNKTNDLEFYIRNERMWIFMGTNKSLHTEKLASKRTANANPKNWPEIVSIFEKFDTTYKYRCGYEFAYGDLPGMQNTDSSMNRSTGIITKENVFTIFKLYNQFCINHKHMVLDMELQNKLNIISENNLYDIEIRYTTENNKVTQIFCYMHNHKTSFEIYLSYARREDGTFIK